MKNLTPFLLSLVLLGCGPAGKDNPDMTGAYRMLSRTLTTATAKDSTEAPANQLKIFTPDFVMWAKVEIADSIPSFGIASYEAEPHKVTESLIYGALDSTAMDDQMLFKLNIEKTDAGFKQVINAMVSQGNEYVLKEEYESVGTSGSSPLDGAWRLTRGYHVNGKDTIENRTIEFKVYGSGHMIFGFTLPDPARGMRTITGFGKFEMEGDNKSKETLATFSYPYMNGMSYDIAIEFMGPDAYRQVIQAGQGIDVEEYQRMKK